MKWSRLGWVVAAAGVLTVGACGDDSDSSDSARAGSGSGAKSGAGGSSSSPAHAGDGAGGDSGSLAYGGGGGGAEGDDACRPLAACDEDPIAFLPCPSKLSDLDLTCRRYITIDQYQACGETVLVVSNGIQTTYYTFNTDGDLLGTYSAGDVGDHACFGEPCLEHGVKEVVCDGVMGYAGDGAGGNGGGASGFAGNGGAGGAP